MIASRRIASPAGPNRTAPAESGPRRISVSHIATSATGSTAGPPSSATAPAIPRILASYLPRFVIDRLVARCRPIVPSLPRRERGLGGEGLRGPPTHSTPYVQRRSASLVTR